MRATTDGEICTLMYFFYAFTQLFTLENLANRTVDAGAAVFAEAAAFPFFTSALNSTRSSAVSFTT